MVDTSSRIAQMRKMVDEGKYFVINRPRQFGKTTSLSLLRHALSKDYTTFHLDFQGVSEEMKADASFIKAFFTMLINSVNIYGIDAPDGLVGYLSECANDKSLHAFSNLPCMLYKLCSMSGKPLVLIIDEVDKAAASSPFISLLGNLRLMYLNKYEAKTFQSVILASVIDIKNLKVKIDPISDEKLSPWNIAADFNIDMSFSAEDIAQMVGDYDEERRIGLNVAEASKVLCDFTSGYPYIVSKMCAIIDGWIADGSHEASEAWSRGGIMETADKLVSSDLNSLLDSMMSKVKAYPDLRKTLYRMLFHGEKFRYNSDVPSYELGVRFGLLKVGKNNVLSVGNRIFETRIYEYFIQVKLAKEDIAVRDKNQFVENGILNMDRVVGGFVKFYDEVYGGKSQKSLEREAGIIFMAYLRAIMNGVGLYFIEAELRDEHRTDIVVSFNNRFYVIELKIWYGEAYILKGEKQLLEYLDFYELDRGYMIIFSFIQSKKVGVTERLFDNKSILEAIV
jgi:hypothetical protein